MNTTNKKIIITGVTGQIGSHMVDYILANTDLNIIGTARRLSVNNHQNIQKNIDNERFSLAQMDLSDTHSISNLIEKEKPDYFINFAANSFVGSSWTYPVQHMEINAIGVLHQLEAIRKYSPNTRYLNLGSSEEFGDVLESPQNEKTVLRPRSPYGASKVAARSLVRVYRDSYNLYALQCFNFNSEGERRGIEFLTRKVTSGVARIKKSLRLKQKFESIKLGSLDSKRDWQSSIDVCDGLWRMLNQDKYNPSLINKYFDACDGIDSIRFGLSKDIKEYVLASGKAHTVKEFVEEAFSAAGIHGSWLIGKTPEDESYIYDCNSSQIPPMSTTLVNVSPKFYRPADVTTLLGDSSLIHKELGWSSKISFSELVRSMVENDINLLK